MEHLQTVMPRLDRATGQHVWLVRQAAAVVEGDPTWCRFGSTDDVLLNPLRFWIGDVTQRLAKFWARVALARVIPVFRHQWLGMAHHELGNHRLRALIAEPMDDVRRI